jgi:hypothetical protein
MAKRRQIKKVKEMCNGEYFHYLMQWHGLGHKDLSTAAGVSVGFINNMLSSKNCEVDFIKKVAAQLTDAGQPLDHEKLFARNGAVPPQNFAPVKANSKTEIIKQAEEMGINLMLKVPVGQNDPGGELTSFAVFMAKAFQEYSEYVEDSNREPGVEGFAEFMRDRRREQRKMGNLGKEEMNEFKNIRVYFVRSFDSVAREKCYFYAIAHGSLHDEIVESLSEKGVIPDFAVIIARGYGDPTNEVKDMIKHCYGFDHDKHTQQND